MTRARTKHCKFKPSTEPDTTHWSPAVPTEYERTKFPVKALKLILHELQATQTLSNEEMKPENAESDDGVRHSDVRPATVLFSLTNDTE